MAQPVVFVVDGDPAVDAIESELDARYGRQYQVVCTRSVDDGRRRLAELAAVEADVAVVLVGPWRVDEPGAQVLNDVQRLHPRSKRAALIGWQDWGQPATGRAIFQGIADGRFDQLVLRPAGPSDEQFHVTISGMLRSWAEENRAAPNTVHIVGTSWTGRAYELRETLKQCAVVHHFCLADSDEGRALVAAAGGARELPLVLFPDGSVLENPTNAELAASTGGPVNPQSTDFDVIIVGGGPAGLSAAVYGASEGFRTLVVDSGGIGGQSTASSLIRNYLGFPHGISGRQLAQDAYTQAWVFGAGFTFMQTATDITREDGHLVVSLSEGDRVRTSAVLLASGVSYRRLGVPSLEELTGAGVFYGGSTSEAPALADREVYVVGGANSAGQAALHLARYARRVTLVVRGASLRDGMSDYLVRQVEATGNIDVRLGCEVVDGGGDARLDHLVLREVASGAETSVVAHGLFIMIGARPNTEWLPAGIARDEQGYVLTGPDVALRSGAWPAERPPFLFETSMPGVFAAGDVRHGSVKRVASAVGQGAIVVQLLHELFAAEQRQPLGLPADHLDPATT